jgi:molybdopterin molybdotransferase
VVQADRDLPPAARSSMDGYAVRHSDIRQFPCVLRVIGEVAAGSPARPRVEPGTCARVFTGANLPPGADAVVMVEQAEEQNGLVTIRFPEKYGANIRRRGEMRAKGDLLARGAAPHAGQVGVCAAVGKASVRVHRGLAPRSCAGTELRSVDDRVRSHETRNSNGPALCAALALWGFPGTKFTVVADRQSALLAALRRAVKRYDVVLFSAGRPWEITISCENPSQRPERGSGSTSCHEAGQAHFVRYDGKQPARVWTAWEPLSALTAFHEFALPALLRLAGAAPETCRPPGGCRSRRPSNRNPAACGVTWRAWLPAQTGLRSHRCAA